MYATLKWLSILLLNYFSSRDCKQKDIKSSLLKEMKLFYAEHFTASQDKIWNAIIGAMNKSVFLLPVLGQKKSERVVSLTAVSNVAVQ